jgi:hypothetical protein
MGLLGSIIGAFFSSLFNSIGSWLSGQQTRADEQTLGEKTQQTADDQVVIKTTQAEAQAAVSAPKSVVGVEAELDKGTF